MTAPSVERTKGVTVPQTTIFIGSSTAPKSQAKAAVKVGKRMTEQFTRWVAQL